MTSSGNMNTKSNSVSTKEPIIKAEANFETSLDENSTFEVEPTVSNAANNSIGGTFKAPSFPIAGISHQKTNKKTGETDKQSVENISAPEFKVKTESDADLPPILYDKPQWAQLPDESADYSLDILRSGVELGNTSLRNGKSFFVFGRLGNCDYQLQHPSISRHHAVLQYGNFGLSDSKVASKVGWHIFDMGSTHGTWWNKQKIPPKQYIRVHVGHMIKFGGSSRIFILQGPDEDAEKESSRTVTQLKEESNRRKLIAEGVLEDPNKKKKPESVENEDSSSGENQEDAGISWGMEEDEEDTTPQEKETEEEIDLESLQQREEYYREDPKKVLRRWFERNEFELNYKFSEKGAGFKHQWVCTIELPIDTPSGKPLEAETVGSGSKREAQVQCALEACRILDANGVLRSQSESKRKKLKSMAENDYYDSDEDNFFDRTGDLERKREARKRRSEEEKKAETYESLCNKLDSTRALIDECQKELDLLTEADSSDSNKRKSGDALDDYMYSLKDAALGPDDVQEKKMQKSKVRLKIIELKQQANHWERLAKIAKPVALPPLKKLEPLSKEGRTLVKEMPDGEKPPLKKGPMIWVGSMKGHRRRRVEAPVAPPVIDGDTTKQEEDNVVEEEEEDEEEKKEDNLVGKISKKEDVTPDEKTLEDAKGNTESTTDKKRVYSVEMPVNSGGLEDFDSGKLEERTETTELPVGTEKRANSPAMCAQNSTETSKSDVIVEPPTKKSKRVQKNRKKKGELTDYDPNDPDYAVWLPPENQSGDGTTTLNAKFGY